MIGKTSAQVWSKVWLLAAALLVALPVTAHAQAASATLTCSQRDNRANFDGDCKTDISVFDRGTGLWQSRNSSNNQYASLQLGQSGDIPVPGDYNGQDRPRRVPPQQRHVVRRD